MTPPRPTPPPSAPIHRAPVADAAPPQADAHPLACVDARVCMSGGTPAAGSTNLDPLSRGYPHPPRIMSAHPKESRREITHHTVHHPRRW